MRRWLIRAAVVAVLIGGAHLLRVTVFATPPVPVQVAEVERGAVEATVTNTRAGTVRARRRAKISPEVGGRVVALPHGEGERVEAGAVLLRLDDRTQRSRMMLAERALEALEAQLAESRTLAERAARELARNRRLAGEGIITADLLDQSESAHLAAEARVRTAAARVGQAHAEVTVAEVELERTVLRAPFAGVVADVQTEVGEWVTPAPPLMPVPPVIDLIDRSALYVVAPMDEVDSAAVQVGQAARVTLDSLPDRVLRGRVVRVASFVLDVAGEARSVEVEVELDDPAGFAAVLPGTSADIEVVLQRREAVLRIPTPALMEGNRVLLVEAGVLVERHLEVGIRNWDHAEVRAGLRSGDQVVMSLGRAEVQPGVAAVIEAPPQARPRPSESAGSSDPADRG